MTPTAELVQSSSAAPERSLQQRREALDRANEIRMVRAQLKKDIRAGRRDVLSLLLEVPEDLETMKLFNLLMAMPKVGRVKANKILQQARISPAKTLGGLSPRQRDEIVSLLPRGLRFTRS